MAAGSLLIKLRNAIVFIACGLVFISVLLYLGYGINLPMRTYRSWFGLGANSTVAEYRGASETARAYWLDKICNDGRCLDTIDWLCGFALIDRTSDDPDAATDAYVTKVTSCFKSLIAISPLRGRISRLRLICGRRYMSFVGNQYSTPK